MQIIIIVLIVIFLSIATIFYLNKVERNKEKVKIDILKGNTDFNVFGNNYSEYLVYYKKRNGKPSTYSVTANSVSVAEVIFLQDTGESFLRIEKIVKI